MAARKVTGPEPRVPGHRPQSGPRDTWPHIRPAPRSPHSRLAPLTSPMETTPLNPEERPAARRRPVSRLVEPAADAGPRWRRAAG